MSIIATYLTQPVQRQRLRAAVRDRHELRDCEDWPALARACDREPVRLAVVDLFADGGANFELLRQIKQRLPRLTLIAYVATGPERAHDLFDAGRAGVDGLVVMDEDDAPRTLLALIEHSEAKSLAALLRRSQEGRHHVVTDAMLLAVTRAHEVLDPVGLARLLALPRRAVTERLAAEGFPPPQRLLTWGRLIVAAHMLEDDHRSADRVALALSFPSGSAFRNTCQRYVHASPSEMRSRGGASYVMRALLRHVDARMAHAGESRAGSVTRTPAVAL